MMENPASADWSPAGSVDHRPVSAPEAAQTRASDLPKRPNDAKLTSEPGVIWRIPVGQHRALDIGCFQKLDLQRLTKHR